MHFLRICTRKVFSLNILFSFDFICMYIVLNSIDCNIDLNVYIKKCCMIFSSSMQISTCINVAVDILKTQKFVKSKIQIHTSLCWKDEVKNYPQFFLLIIKSRSVYDIRISIDILNSLIIIDRQCLHTAMSFSQPVII